MIRSTEARVDQSKFAFHANLPGQARDRLTLRVCGIGLLLSIPICPWLKVFFDVLRHPTFGHVSRPMGTLDLGIDYPATVS